MRTSYILIDVEITGERNVIKKEAYNRNSVIKNVKANVIPVKKKGTTRTISKSLKKKNIRATNRKSTKSSHHKENSHVGHCTHTAESTNGKVQNILYAK